MPIVGPHLDPCQYGLKGAYITHYLFKLLQFIHEHLDMKDPHAVVVALVDLSKAFNQVSRQMVIEDFYDITCFSVVTAYSDFLSDWEEHVYAIQW